MPALWIAHVTVTDEEAYGRYAKLGSGIIKLDPQPDRDELDHRQEVS